VLHRLRAQPRADRGQRRLALVTVQAAGAHLDQLVRIQRAADLRDDRLGEPFLAEVQDGVEGVRARPERLQRASGQGLAPRWVQFQPPGMSWLGSRMLKISLATPSGENCT
jgi:hypothetical protein